MKKILPPLKPIPAFEAAARHASFKKAGEELCVTSSAISHQIRALEEWLGVALFERGAQSAALTDFGKRYARELSPLLARLEKISNEERVVRPEKKCITIQTTDSFAARWLIPRLPEFASLHPDIGIKIVTYDFRDDLRAAEADLGVVFMAGDEPRAGDARLLLAEEIFPVCSPALLQNCESPSIGELSNFTLIHDDNLGVTWTNWIAKAAGHSASAAIDTGDGPHYNHSHLALHAAELGDGFALASDVLTFDARNAGRLVAPFPDKVAAGCGYYLAAPDNAGDGDCRRFTDWIVSVSARASAA